MTAKKKKKPSKEYLQLVPETFIRILAIDTRNLILMKLQWYRILGPVISRIFVKASSAIFSGNICIFMRSSCCDCMCEQIQSETEKITEIQVNLLCQVNVL